MQFTRKRKDDGITRIVDETSKIELLLLAGPSMESEYFGFFDPAAPKEIYSNDPPYLRVRFDKILGPIKVANDKGVVEQATGTVGYRTTVGPFVASLEKYLPYARLTLDPPAALRDFVAHKRDPRPLTPEQLVQLAPVIALHSYLAEFLRFHLRDLGISSPIVEIRDVDMRKLT